MKKIIVFLIAALFADTAFAQTKAISVARVSASCTPNTAIYVSGDAVCNALTFSGILGSSMKGFVLEASVADTEKLATAYDVKCKGSPFLGTVTDHAQFDPVDQNTTTPASGDLPLFNGLSILTTDQYVYSDNGEEGYSGAKVYVESKTPTTNQPERSNLYCALIARGTPDWAAAQTVTLTLVVETLQ